MNLARLTDDAKAFVAQAHLAALQAGAGAVAPEHLLLALLARPGAQDSLADQAIDATAVRAALEAASSMPPAGAQRHGKVLEPSPALERLVSGVWEKVKDGLRHQVHLTDLVRALMDEEAGSSIHEKLRDAGIKAKSLEKSLLEHISGRDSEEGAPRYRNLRSFSRCLTEMARQGLLDPVIGRHEEIRRLMQVLCRRVKNNPVLIGQPGVGRTAIVEGLARRIACGDVPELLKDKELFALDIQTLIAGAEYRGVLDERTKGVMSDIRAGRGDVIVFIDELHSIVRAGGGSSDVSGVLKPALAAGEMRCIGVASLDEYRNYIEKDGALERRLQPIFVDEPTVDETISILRGIKGRYEAYHDIHISDAALVAAANLSHRFISDRSLPDKAVDLIDEAAAKVRIEWDSMPVAVDSAGRHITQMESELRELPPGRSSREEQARRIEERIDQMRLGVQEASAGWEAQGALASRIRAGRERLAWHEFMVERPSGRAPRADDALTRLRQQLAADEASLAQLQKGQRLCKADIDEEDVAEVVATSTGIPISKLMENERTKLLFMEESLHQRVVGQDSAVRAVSNAVRLARVGMKDPNRPVGSFLFLGPTGVGKTELSRALAEFLFDDEAAMVRIDMSEYMDKHTISRLTGAPPGYIGYDESGQLTETVRRKPYSVVLFDETEKAHPDVFNILLQIMDDGRLTDGHGRTIDFKNTIITMTSNVGGHLYRENLGKEGVDLRGLLDEQLRAHFRPEFLNRVDAIVYFDLLREEQIKDIVDIQIRLVNRRMAGGGIRLEVTDPVKAHLAREGFDPLQGARPLKRLIQRKVLEPLALRVLQGQFKEGDTIVVTMGGGGKQELAFKRRPIPAPKRKAGRRATSSAASPSTNGESRQLPSRPESPEPLLSDNPR